MGEHGLQNVEVPQGPVTADMQVAASVTARPSRARVYEKYRIDYCCGGKIPVSEACEKKTLAVDQLLKELADHDALTVAEDDTVHTRWEEAPLGELVDHIMAKHHAYVRDELPRLLQKAERVAAVHGATHPETIKVLEIFKGLKAEFETHMDKEDNVLFPWIKGLENGTGGPPFPGMKMNQPVACMEEDHEHTAQAFEAMAGLTNGYQAPPEACNTYRVLYEGLRDLELDTYQHVHKENNILFPRALLASQA